MFIHPARSVLLLLLFIAPGIALSQVNESEAADQKQSYEKAMAELKAAKDGNERFYALDDAAKESFRQNRESDARSFAEELAQLAPKYKGDWNYGNAVQDFNLVLGLLALKKGDADAARARLLAAGRSPGSPQMDSFGPNMSLAKALLEKGEKKWCWNILNCARSFGRKTSPNSTNGRKTWRQGARRTLARISTIDPPATRPGQVMHPDG